MARFACVHCGEAEDLEPYPPPIDWTPVWRHAPDLGPYAYEVKWCCSNCTDDEEERMQSHFAKTDPNKRHGSDRPTSPSLF